MDTAWGRKKQDQLKVLSGTCKQLCQYSYETTGINGTASFAATVKARNLVPIWKQEENHRRLY